MVPIGPAGLTVSEGNGVVSVVSVVSGIFAESLPAVRVFSFVDFSLHMPDYFLLERGEASVHLQRRLVRLGNGHELHNLPLPEAFRFLDGRERIATERRLPIRHSVEELAIFASQHG